MALQLEIYDFRKQMVVCFFFFYRVVTLEEESYTAPPKNP